MRNVRMDRLAAVLTFCVLAPVVLCAQDTAVSYSIALRAAMAVDAPEAIAGELASDYGGTLAGPVRGLTFAMRLSPSRARVLARDPRVASMVVQTAAAPAIAEAMSWGTGVPYTYDGAGNVRKIGTDSFVYDAVSRLVQADTNGVRRNYEYDGFGNRTRCRESEGTPTEAECQQAFTINPANNRVEGVTYDAAGNVTSFGGHTYTYDALNMQTRDSGGPTPREFLYTASDERIAVYTVGQSWRWTIRDTSGKVLREFASYDGPNGLGTASWQWTKDYVWRDGLLLASRQMVGSSVTTYHHHLDHLGSPRRVTDGNDRIVGIHDYIPFGPEASGGQQEPSLSLLKYTGHERDLLGSESWNTLDYMHARYYNPTLGRFLSVDPVLDMNRAVPEPQRWNRYSYVVNNPVNRVDPDGRADRASEIASGVFGFLPVAGEIQDGTILFTGYDPITAEKQSGFTRAVSGVSLVIPFVGGKAVAGVIGAAAALLARNAAQGRAFEKAALGALDALKNNTKITGEFSGGVGRSIPDTLKNGITEIKSSKALSFDRQLQIQHSVAVKTGQPFNLVVSPQTQTISANLQNAVKNSGGSIQVFDPATKTFSAWGN